MSQQQAFHFFKRTHNLMEKISDAKLQPKLRNFLDAITTFDVALKSVSNGQLAEKISLENNNRNSAFEFIREQTELLLAENSELGKKISSVLSEFMELPQKTDEEKTELIRSLVGELERIHISDESSEIKISDSISLLKRSNWAYNQYLKAQKIELTGKCLTYETLATRRRTEDIYAEIVEFINAMLIYNGDEEYIDIIDQINHVIDQTYMERLEFNQAVYA
jgi:hypothetical protein